MGDLSLTLQVGVCVLISIAAVLTLLLVWRDDHKWLERHKDLGPVAEAGPYPLDLHELVHRRTIGHHGRS